MEKNSVILQVLGRGFCKSIDYSICEDALERCFHGFSTLSLTGFSCRIIVNGVEVAFFEQPVLEKVLISGGKNK